VKNFASEIVLEVAGVNNSVSQTGFVHVRMCVIFR